MPPPRNAPASDQAGFTIIETMVALSLLLIGMVATLTMVEQAASTTVKTRTREQATNLQREVIEGARSVPYEQLTVSGSGAAIRTRPALGDASGEAGWNVNRRDARYTVAVGVCTVDDPRDGIGAHEPGLFCPAAPEAPQDANLDGTVDDMASGASTSCAAPCPDTAPADYKRVVSLVRWTQGGTALQNVQSAQINSPGLAAAPAVLNVAVAPAPVTDPSTGSVAVTATTNNVPATVQLFADGTAIGSAALAAKDTWTGAWTIGPVTPSTTAPAAPAQPPASETLDGSYEIGAKAFDQYGQYGATRSEVVVVNRRVAYAPARVEAGRNGAGVEIEWSPAKERDSEGFRVDRRVNGGPWAEACAVKVRTTCRDLDAPAAATGQTLEYSVVGYDRDPSTAQRAGDRSEIVTIADPSPLPPGPPGSLSGKVEGGDVVLTWTRPLLGDTPDHYNVYRDGLDFSNRLTSVYLEPGDPLRYTDARAAGQGHTYAITAVNAQLGESVKLGPVKP